MNKIISEICEDSSAKLVISGREFAIQEIVYLEWLHCYRFCLSCETDESKKLIKHWWLCCLDMAFDTDNRVDCESDLSYHDYYFQKHTLDSSIFAEFGLSSIICKEAIITTSHNTFKVKNLNFRSHNIDHGGSDCWVLCDEIADSAEGNCERQID